MKHLLAIALVFGISSVQAEAIMQKVCHDTVVKGKTVQQCKTIKIHRKVEGTTVPDAPIKKKK